MRRHHFLIIGRIGYQPPPLAVVVEVADGIAQRAAAADRASELDGQAAQHRFRFQVAARAPDLVLQHLAHREMLHQRDDVGEAFVQRQHVGIRGRVEAAVHAVQNGVRGFVRHDVVRQAGVDCGARHVIARIAGRRLEVSEQQRDLLRAVVGIRLPQRVRIDLQALAVAAVVGLVLRIVFGPPQHGPAERALENGNRGHRDCVNRLLMKRRIAFGGRTAVLAQQPRIVQIDRLVFDAGGVLVDHLQVLAVRSLLQIVFPFHVQDHFVDGRGIQLVEKLGSTP